MNSSFPSVNGWFFLLINFHRANPSKKIYATAILCCQYVVWFIISALSLFNYSLSEWARFHSSQAKISTSLCLFSAMVFSASFSHNSFSCLTQFPQNFRRNPLRFHLIRAVKSTEPEKKVSETKTQELPVAEPSSSSSPTASPKVSKKPVYSSEFLLLFCFQSIGNLRIQFRFVNFVFYLLFV